MPLRPSSRLAPTILLCFAVSAGSALTPVEAKERAPKNRRVQEDIRFAAEMAEKGLWREALYRWRRALDARPEDPRLHNNVGVALEALGELDEAIAHYERALELADARDRGEVEANFVLAKRSAKLVRPASSAVDDSAAAEKTDDAEAAEEAEEAEEARSGTDRAGNDPPATASGGGGS